ncbi:unnamed protein product [Rotaria magnacalcarata]|uniref:Uncharacterized protein n=1 Tax=Rotaria magnacalcarata TaxID=392030 RepID=A0A816X5A6_9BILA|nr:unnamed protein product [Rotaria magnacalcarata]
MLSNDGYRDIKWKLDNVTKNLSGQQRHNYKRSLRQQIKEHEYATKFSPSEPLPYIPYYINRTTTAPCLRQLIQAATASSEYTLDTESMNIYKEGNQLTLIQLQIFLPHNSSCAIIIEVCHLPNENHICYELKPFVIFKLFSNEQLDCMNPINLQEQFKLFWNKQHRHKSNTSSSSHASNNICHCETCIGIGTSELWSLQNSIAFTFNEYLSKQLTNQNFNIGT